MKSFANLVLFVAGFASALPQPLFSTESDGPHFNMESHLVKRTKHASTLLPSQLPVCAHDNLFRIFLDKRYSSSASAFCSTYITSTSISTITPLTTATRTALTTDATAFSTIIVTATKTSTTPAPDATITLIPKEKRQALASCPGKAGTYPPDRISSACSCLVTPAVILSTTTTAFLSTVTVASTMHITKIATTIQTSTAVVNVAGPPTSTATVHNAPAAPAPAPVPEPYCALTVDNTVGSSGAAFTVICGLSYATLVPLVTVTSASYQECGDVCGNDGLCRAFSYSVLLFTDNCRTFDNIPSNTILDLNINSGILI